MTLEPYHRDPWSQSIVSDNSNLQLILGRQETTPKPVRYTWCVLFTHISSTLLTKRAQNYLQSAFHAHTQIWIINTCLCEGGWKGKSSIQLRSLQVQGHSCCLLQLANAGFIRKPYEHPLHSYLIIHVMQAHKTTLWFKKADKISNLICFAQSMQYHLSFSARSEYPFSLVLSGPTQRIFSAENITKAALRRWQIPTMVC